MLCRLCIVIFISGALAARAGAYEDHLQPPDSIYTGIALFDYEIMAVKYFEQGPDWEDYDQDLLASVIVLPSFVREYRIGLKYTKGKYRIATITPEVMLFMFYTMQQRKADREADGPDAVRKADDEFGWIKHFRDQGREPPEKLGDIRAERCARDINEALAKKVLSAWYGMLRQTRYTDDPMAGKGLDGTNYYFTMTMAGFVMSGKAWSPPEDSRTGRLVAMAESMRRYCLGGGVDVARKLTQQADDLLRRLEN